MVVRPLRSIVADVRNMPMPMIAIEVADNSVAMMQIGSATAPGTSHITRYAETASVLAGFARPLMYTTCASSPMVALAYRLTTAWRCVMSATPPALQKANETRYPLGVWGGASL